MRPERPGGRCYYRDHVIGGPDAFLVIINIAHDFARAIRQKLLREIAAR
ncbi:DUF1194 domain-containing protein [Labrys miyagiensis]|nr:DUF1194 domain-containing protein [Labrys miyagiensis]